MGSISEHLAVDATNAQAEAQVSKLEVSLLNFG
jgi:hypothetical protein